MEENLLNNPNFREDMKVFFTFTVLVPAIAVASVCFDVVVAKNKSNKQQTEYFGEKNIQKTQQEFIQKQDSIIKYQTQYHR